jgi:hypothetical protein
VVHAERKFTYAELYARSRRLASALTRRGVEARDTVAVMAPNVPAMLEAHYGMPMAGVVLNALNYRLDARTIAFILEHADAKLLIADTEFSDTVGPALRLLPRPIPVVDVVDLLADPAPTRRDRLRAAARRRRSRARVGASGRRVAGPGAPLHLGNDGKFQGRRVLAPWGLPERPRQRAGARSRAAVGIPVDAADVPLQRVDAHVGGDRGGRDARMSPQG